MKTPEIIEKLETCVNQLWNAANEDQKDGLKAVCATIGLVGYKIACILQNIERKA